MRVTHAFVALLATAGVGAQGQAAELDTRDTQRYPVYPEHYDDSYCCMTIVPYTNKCRKGRCEYAPGWRCFFGTGKVNSIRQCEVEVGGDTDAYCKRPGYE